MKRIVTMIMLLAVALTARAFDFSRTLDGGQVLYFTVISSTATVKVVNPGWSSYTPPAGHVTVPATVDNNGVTYSVVEIASRAFAGCDGLTHITLSEGITTIGTLAFMACTALDTIDLPSTLTSLANEAFNGTAFLSNTSNWSDGGMMLYAGDYLVKVRSAAEDSVVVRDGTLGIAGMAVYYCGNLDSVILPSSLRFIGPLAFAACERLAVLRMGGDTPPTITADCFDNTPDVTIAVPCGTLETYQGTDIWSSLTLEERCADTSSVDTSSVDPNPINPNPVPIPWPGFRPYPDGPLVFVDDSTRRQSIDGIEGAPFAVVMTATGITVSTYAGCPVRVCDVMGRTVTSTVAVQGNVSIALPASGVYLVCTPANKPRKIHYRR